MFNECILCLVFIICIIFNKKSRCTSVTTVRIPNNDSVIFAKLIKQLRSLEANTSLQYYYNRKIQAIVVTNAIDINYRRLYLYYNNDNDYWYLLDSIEQHIKYESIVCTFRVSGLHSLFIISDSLNLVSYNCST